MTITVSAVTIGIFALLVAAALAVVLLFWSRNKNRIISPEVLQEAVKVDEQWLNVATSAQPSGTAKQADNQYLQALLRSAGSRLKEYEGQLIETRQQAERREAEYASELAQQKALLSDSLRDIEVSREHLYHMAYHDSLTSLPNRRLFREQLEQLLRMAERHGEQLAILFIDLDDFKRINDSVGHSAGDSLLQEVAQRILSCVRDSDLVAHNVDTGPSANVSRIGGDEFTVVLPQLEKLEAAGVVAKRIVDAVGAPFTIEGQELTVTPSIGIALAPGDASDAQGLLKASDIALYYAKGQGKNHFAYYQDHMTEPAQARIRMEADLRGALQRGELELHYQPQVDTRTATVMGAEALLRWNHPELGLVPPMRFIPVAEEINIIDELGKWTITQACQQLKAFHAKKLKLPMITVNISALQFRQELIGTVSEALAVTGVAASQLQLELQEGVAMKDLGESIRILNGLKELGVSLCIDNFGTGYSPLGYLNSFPLDMIKVDRSYLVKSQISEKDANLVAAIIDIARNMKLGLVAEGVESIEQYQFLNRQGVQFMQGYLFSAPVSARELENMLAPWHFMEFLRQLSNHIGNKPAQDETQQAENPPQ